MDEGRDGRERREGVVLCVVNAQTATKGVFCGSKVLTVLTLITNLNATYKSFTIFNITGCSLTNEGTARCVACGSVLCMLMCAVPSLCR